MIEFRTAENWEQFLVSFDDYQNLPGITAYRLLDNINLFTKGASASSYDFMIKYTKMACDPKSHIEVNAERFKTYKEAANWWSKRSGMAIQNISTHLFEVTSLLFSKTFIMVTQWEIQNPVKKAVKK